MIPLGFLGGGSFTGPPAEGMSTVDYQGYRYHFHVGLKDVPGGGTRYLTVHTTLEVEYFLVAAGGGGGSVGGGGGAGGVVIGTGTLTNGVYEFHAADDVGLPGGLSWEGSVKGNASRISKGGVDLFRAEPGGNGGSYTPHSSGSPWRNGSSGGGGGATTEANHYGGSGIPGQGHDGGNGTHVSLVSGGGGGGAGGPGANGGNNGGNGGAGVYYPVWAAATGSGDNGWYASGGGGWSWAPATPGTAPPGGGGNGSAQGDGAHGLHGTGGGGGGGGYDQAAGRFKGGGDGGTGVAAIRYPIPEGGFGD